MEYTLFLAFVLSFLVTFVSIPIWINMTKRSGLVGKDMNKYEKNEVSEVGGIPVIMGFSAGVLLYIAITTFYFDNVSKSLFAMALLSSIFIITIIGIVDDVLGWKIGLRQMHKPFLTLAAALPIIVINAGHSDMALPFIGVIDFGLLYPLVLIPLAIVGASNGFNLLAGYNGLEALMGIMILSVLGFIAWLRDNGWISVIALSMVFALLAFYYYNKYPARIFPGDTLTYSVGALIAAIAILGNMEKAAVILFIPYFFELVIKGRYKMQTECFAIPQEDGSLKAPAKLGSSTHLVIRFLSRIKKKVYEKDVLAFYVFVELFLVAVVFVEMMFQ